MKPFLIDNDKVYTYQDLLDAIQTDGFYYPYYKVHDVFLYFVNLVKALANNQSLVLLDSDLNSSEIENLDESLVNQPRIINTSSFSDVADRNSGKLLVQFSPRKSSILFHILLHQ